jgi:hypothetical protein
MTNETLLGYSAEDLAKLSDAELKALCEPLFPKVRSKVSQPRRDVTKDKHAKEMDRLTKQMLAIKL